MSGTAGPVLLVGPTADEVYTLPERGYVLIGREEHCDVVVPDPTVSRRHAAVRRREGEDWLEDLDSRGGTSVNGTRLSAPRRLIDGDEIRLAGHELRYQRPPGARSEEKAPTGGGVQFHVQDQRAGTINNVARDQYLSYVAHVQQQRDSFARDIAATKTKASWLAWIGLAISVAGFIVYAQVILRFLAAIFAAIARGGGNPDFRSLESGPGGIAGIAIGFLAVIVGGVMLVVGIIMHVMAAARRRRIDEQLPLPPPPWGVQPERSSG
jgi:hypothetical protein